MTLVTSMADLIGRAATRESGNAANVLCALADHLRACTSSRRCRNDACEICVRRRYEWRDGRLINAAFFNVPRAERRVLRFHIPGRYRAADLEHVVPLLRSGLFLAARHLPSRSWIAVIRPVPTGDGSFRLLAHLITVRSGRLNMHRVRDEWQRAFDLLPDHLRSPVLPRVRVVDVARTAELVALHDNSAAALQHLPVRDLLGHLARRRQTNTVIRPRGLPLRTGSIITKPARKRQRTEL